MISEKNKQLVWTRENTQNCNHHNLCRNTRGVQHGVSKVKEDWHKPRTLQVATPKMVARQFWGGCLQVVKGWGMAAPGDTLRSPWLCHTPMSNSYKIIENGKHGNRNG
jgi:hypothetical protein